MKRIAAYVVIWLAVFTLAGCPANTPTPTPPIAPGYMNQADQVMGETLAAARAFYRTVQCETQTMNWQRATDTCVPDPDITSPMVLTPGEKTAYNAFGQALNVAEPVYLAYHAGAATQAAAQTAVDTVAQDQSALSAMGVKP
jgi:hypothetical protein